MNNELLFLDLSCRINKVKVSVNGKTKLLTDVYSNRGFGFDNNGVFYGIKSFEIKPYLRDMKDMTKDERKHFANLLFSDLPGVKEDFYKAIDYLNLINVDYRGLIDLELAIKVTEKNNPY